MNVGIYGGSFNPVHAGHVRLAQRAVADLALDRLVVVPANVSPFKAGEARETREFPWDRLEMVEAAFAAIPEAVVDRREIARGGVSYAIDTVREIAAENPRARLYFLVGEDSLASLARWKDWDELRRLAEFRAYPRTRESSTEIRELFARGRVALNGDAALVAAVRAGLRRKGGYCPCRLARADEYFCPCDEFKGQLADDAYHGFCHCRLYVKP